MHLGKLLVATIAIGILTAPALTAHEFEGEVEPRCDDEVFFHLCLDIADLEPGANKTRHLLSPEGDLRAGWVYIIYGGVDGQGTIIADLVHDNKTVESFVWTPGFHKNSTRIQSTGEHHLVLRNPSNDTSVRYAFYYDQSCNCVGKVIPLSGGFVLFNNKFPGDTDISVDFPMIDGWRLHAAAAWLPDDAPQAHWPNDYTILTETTAKDQGWLELDFHTDEPGTYYVFVQALDGASPDDPVHLTPQWEVHDETDEAAAGMLPVWGSLVLVVALFAMIRRTQ